MLYSEICNCTLDLGDSNNLRCEEEEWKEGGGFALLSIVLDVIGLPLLGL
jgi:hypothetical protein